nr:hypothetical protein [uncultured Pseudomonas sp.]
MSRQPDTPKNSAQCQIPGNPPKDDSAKDKTNGDAANGKAAKDNPQAVKQAIERNREAFQKGAQVPGGAYDVDPAYAATGRRAPMTPSAAISTSNRISRANCPDSDANSLTGRFTA